MKVLITTTTDKFLIDYPSVTFLNDLRTNLRSSMERKSFIEIRGMDNITKDRVGRDLMINPNLITNIEISSEINDVPLPRSGVTVKSEAEIEEEILAKQPLAPAFKKAQEVADKKNREAIEVGR